MGAGQALMQMLSSGNISTDRPAALLFKGRRDERESRFVAQCCGEVRCCVRSLWCSAVVQVRRHGWRVKGTLCGVARVVQNIAVRSGGCAVVWRGAVVVLTSGCV